MSNLCVSEQREAQKAADADTNVVTESVLVSQAIPHKLHSVLSNQIANSKRELKQAGDVDMANERQQTSVQLGFGSSTMNKISHEVADAMDGEIFVCDFQVLLENYGPVNVPPEDVKACKQSLQDLLGNFDGVERWKTYPSSASPIGGEEHEIFAQVKTIQNAISDWAKIKKKANNDHVLKLVPKRNIDAGIDSTNRHMNACIIEHEYSSKLPCSAVVFPMNMKTGENASHFMTVREEIVADCHHILLEDPRREFIFALTIENDRASLWYFSRTHSTKSQSFDCITDIDKFIAVFLSLAYATPEQLGFDPCVHKSPLDDGHYVYEFSRLVTGTSGNETDTTPPARPIEEATQVTPPSVQATNKRPLARTRDAAKAAKDPMKGKNKIFYLTRECLKSSRPQRISGRINRIWRAIEIKSPQDVTPTENTSEVIIKDVWLHKSHESEGENQDRFFADVDAFVENGVKRAVEHYLDSNPSSPSDGAAREKLQCSEKTLQAFIDSEPCFRGLDAQTRQRLQNLLTGHKYRSLFLKKLHHHKGNATKARAKDTTCRDVFLSSATKAKPTDDAHYTPATGSSSSYQTGHTRNSKDSHTMKANGRWEQKQRNRFVYEEVCLDLNQLPTLRDVMDVLAQAADALLIMYCAGWLHRDISIGNILALQTPNGYKVKLADLEFARRMYDESKLKSDSQIGTPFFMALETMMRRSFFVTEGLVKPFELPAASSLASKFGLQPDHPGYDLLSRTKVHPAFSNLTGPPSNADFTHLPTGRVKPNYQHDLESLWWIALFIVTSLVDHQKSQVYASTVFRHQLEPSSARSAAFQYDIDGQLFTVLREDLCDVFAPFLESLRHKMHTKSITMEVFGQQANHAEYSEIHGFFSTAFRDLMANTNKSWQSIRIKKSSRDANSKVATGLADKRSWEDNGGSSLRPHKKTRLSGP